MFFFFFKILQIFVAITVPGCHSLAKERFQNSAKTELRTNKTDRELSTTMSIKHDRAIDRFKTIIPIDSIIDIQIISL